MTLNKTPVSVGLIAITIATALSLSFQSGAQPAEKAQFEGRGLATGSIFGVGRNVKVALNLSQNTFSLVLAVPQASSKQEVHYTGTHASLRRGTVIPTSFTVEGSIQTFASSDDNLRAINSSGTCRIKILNSQVVSSVCNTRAAANATRFNGT